LQTELATVSTMCPKLKQQTYINFTTKNMRKSLAGMYKSCTACPLNELKTAILTTTCDTTRRSI